MNGRVVFSDRGEFRVRLHGNCLSNEGVWLLLGKAGGPKTLKVGGALEEALCFGWTDGQIQSVDDKIYKKYLSLYRESSEWSERNKTLAERPERQGIVTDHGRKRIEETRKNGRWDTPKPLTVTEDQTAVVTDLSKGHEPAHTNFLAISQSVEKTCTRAYFDAKTDTGREKRMAWMVDRSNKNSKPM